MHPTDPSKRRRRHAQLAPECLESRSLMTGGAGDTFAIVRGEVTKPGEPAVIKFTIDADHFTLPTGKLALGVDVASINGSSIKPLITSVKAANGKIIPQTFHSVYDPHLTHIQAASGRSTSAVLTSVQLDHKNPKAPVTYTVNVSGVGNTTGPFLVGFYLPGDANGDGVVDQTDVNLIKSAMNSRANDGHYNFEADANRDGRIGSIDLAYAKQNLGVKTTVNPAVSANLDNGPGSGITGRVSTTRDVKITGTMTPGGSVTFAETANKSTPVTVRADAKGSYSVNLKLGDGSNTYRVSTLDPFGQSITGTLAPVTYTPPQANNLKATAAATTQPAVTVKPA